MFKKCGAKHISQRNYGINKEVLSAYNPGLIIRRQAVIIDNFFIFVPAGTLAHPDSYREV